MLSPDQKKLVEIELKELVKDIVSAYDKKGMRATGETADSLEVVMNDNGGKIYGNENITQLEYGRRPGRVSAEGYARLKKWVVAKGLVESTAKAYKINQVAYIVKRKIESKGYDRGGDLKLLSSVLTEERISDIQERMSEPIFNFFVARVQNELTKLFENDSI